MIDSKKVDWPKLLADGEWLGKKMDEEIDLVRKSVQIWWESQTGGRDN
jgi:hypothetical protein